MKRTMKIDQRWYMIGLLVFISILSLGVGVKDFNLFSFLSGASEEWKIAIISRLPRLMSILVSGASLSIAGLIMQSMTNNKFVSPSSAGTMEWCRFGIMLAILFFGDASSMTRILVAFLTSLFGTFIFMKLLTSIKMKDALLVPLIGMMLGSVISAMTTFVAYRYDIIQNMSSWMQGNFSLILKGNYELLYLGIPFLLLAMVFAKQFTIVGMGSAFSKNLGINHQQIVLLGLIIISVISSLVVVNVGSISFVGLIIPNLVSMMKGDHLQHTILDTALYGAFFLLICDLISRLLIAPYEIPISVVVSIIGSVSFLFLLRRRNQHV